MEKKERVLESAQHRSGIRMYLLPVLDIRHQGRMWQFVPQTPTGDRPQSFFPLTASPPPSFFLSSILPQRGVRSAILLDMSLGPFVDSVEYTLI